MTLRSCFWWIPSLYSIADCMFKWPKGFHAPTLRRKAIPQWTATITEITFEIMSVIKHLVCSRSPFSCIYLFVACIQRISMFWHMIWFAFLHLLQESVSSVFGCGLSAACVVDVGDEKTSICCVEDGLVIPSSR